MPRSTVTSKGQVTIPKEVRDELGLKPGDRVEFIKDASGKTTLQPIRSNFMALKGIIKSPLKRPMTIEEMDAAVGRALVARYRRCK
jgi:AbrB family looped-hinge helix DNA binding protein